KDMPELEMEKVLDEPMWVAVPAGHKLASQTAGQPLRLEDLSNEPFVLYRRRAGQGLYDAILGAYVRAGFSPHIVQEAPRLTSCLSLVGAGLGISIVPESMTRLGGDGVVFLPLDTATQLSAPLYLARREDSHSSAIINMFCDLVKTQLKAD
ncbi:LysR substrate-binding domain-containing protein, partial [Rahnella perminowiae]